MPTTTTAKLPTSKKTSTAKKAVKSTAAKSSPKVKAKTPAKTTSRRTKTQPLTNDQIAARAYQIWETSGHPNGQEEANWFRAVTELSNAA